MWRKAMIWALISAILLLALGCLATPTISGWPEGLELDEEVDTPSVNWWQLMESAAVACKFPAVFSRVRVMLTPVPGA